MEPPCGGNAPSGMFGLPAPPGRMKPMNCSMLAPVASSTLAIDSVEGQRSRPSAE